MIFFNNMSRIGEVYSDWSRELREQEYYDEMYRELEYYGGSELSKDDWCEFIDYINSGE